MKFAKIVFWIAGIWGVLVLTPLFFIFDSIGRNDPPPVTHPGFYYGFATVGLAFQFIFIVIATDPVRYRPVMIPSVFEKVSYVIAVVTLYLSTEFIQRNWHLPGQTSSWACCLWPPTSRHVLPA